MKPKGDRQGDGGRRPDQRPGGEGRVARRLGGVGVVAHLGPTSRTWEASKKPGRQWPHWCCAPARMCSIGDG
jgi:hypothetical protein